VTSDRPGVELSVCESCHAGYFPHRLICPNCGAGAWRLERERCGTVEETTTVHRRVGADSAPSVLATIRLDGGQRVVARLTQSLPRGSRVALTQTGGLVSASVKQP
jgi:uncharacterized OB-fold protein